MNLADLLARELESWPEDSVAVVQYCGGVIPKNAYGVNQLENLDYDSSGSSWLLGYGVYCKSPIELSEVASDHSTAIITRAQWQSARDKLKGETKVTKPKANKDGWIRHRGGISEPIRAEDSAQGDMGDWRNWLPGDLVEVIKETEHSGVKKGTVMPIESIDEDDRDQPIWIGAYCPHISALKWHSRPSRP